MFRTPKIIQKIYPSLVWEIPSTEKVLYLTFDDGPVPEATPFVLDQLKKYNAKATFFCIGDNIVKHPQIFERIMEEGHAVGNHSFNHMNGWRSDNESYLNNIEKCQHLLNGRPLIYRPPYGKIKRSQIEALIEKNYKIIMWTVLSKDYDQKVKETTCLKNVLKYTNPGKIVLFHDSIKAYKNMSYTLPKFLDHFASEAYQFKTVV